MGCAASKSNDEEEDVVGLCRERKRLIKSAVECRFALAEAQCKYNQSLYAVALALKLFVARHCSRTSSFLITFPRSSEPTTENLFSNPMYLPQRPSIVEFKTQEAIAPKSPNLETENDEEQDEEYDDEEEGDVCEHFHGGVGPQLQSSEVDYGWDFFSPFDGVSGFKGQNSDEDLRAVREAEGIPELEEDVERESFRERKSEIADDGGGRVKGGGVEDVRTVGDANVSQGEQKGLKVIDNPKKGRELLEALKDVEDHFVRAYESGIDVSKMLETNVVHLQSGLEEIKESSNKLIQSIPWRRSTSSRSSSCKSFLASSSKSSSTWTEFRNDLFDDQYQGMQSGSHSLTLGRLYAWEKKLYEEVKAGEQTRKLYERKCLQLRNQDSGDEGLQSLDTTRAEVRDLNSRILVSIRSAESIAMRIQRLRDDELQPQLVELLHGLMRTWKIMLDAHETQNRTMSEVKSFTSPYGKFCNDTHCLATLQLEAELQNWRVSFAEYVSSQKAYLESLHGWLSKFVTPEFCGPPLVLICRDWLASLKKLPDQSVIFAMKSFGKDVRALSVQQGEEQKQKRKVDELAKELEKRVVEFQRAEGKILESKLSEQKTEIDVRNRIEFLEERKGLLELFRTRLDAEKVKHNDRMQETERITLDGFQIGFSSVFESLIEFSKASVKMYGDLVTYTENGRMGVKTS